MILVLWQDTRSEQDKIYFDGHCCCARSLAAGLPRANELARQRGVAWCLGSWTSSSLKAKPLLDFLVSFEISSLGLLLPSAFPSRFSPSPTGGLLDLEKRVPSAWAPRKGARESRVAAAAARSATPSISFPNLSPPPTPRATQTMFSRRVALATSKAQAQTQAQAKACTGAAAASLRRPLARSMASFAPKDPSKPGGRHTQSGRVVTVFGGTGFLGQYIISMLGARGDNVVIPFRGDDTEINHLKVCCDYGKAWFLPFSVRDRATLEKAVSQSDTVINLIGKSYETTHFAPMISNYNFTDVHVTAAREIADVSRRAGVQRLVHVSALQAQHGDRSESEWISSKALGEVAVRNAYPEATIVRPVSLDQID